MKRYHELLAQLAVDLLDGRIKLQEWAESYVFVRSQLKDIDG